MTEREALKLALEALEVIYDRAVFDYSLPADHFAAEGAQQAIAAIKEALAQPEQIPPSAYSNTHQPEQEPIAWITEKISGPTKGYMTVTFNKDTGWKDARSIPLYEHPPQRKPLTHEQRFDLLTKFEPHKNKWEAPAILIDMVEAAHGIKE